MQFVACFSLQRKLIVAFIVVGLIPTLILALYHLVEMHSLLLERASLEYRQRAEMHARYAEALVASAVADVQAVAQSPSLLHADTNDTLLADLTVFLEQAGNPYQALCTLAIAAGEQRCLRSPFPGEKAAWTPVVEAAPTKVVYAAHEVLSSSGEQSGSQPAPVVLIDGQASDAPVLSLLTLVHRQDGAPLAVTLELPAQVLFEALVDPESSVCTSIVDASGTPLFQSVACRSGASGVLHASSPPLRDRLHVFGDASSMLLVSGGHSQMLHVFVPVRPPDQTGLDWTVIYTLPVSAITGRIWVSQIMIVVVTLGALLIAQVTAMRLTRDIVRPVLALAAAAERVGNGDLHTPIPSAGHDEIGALGRTFDHTVARLREAIAATESRRQEAETLRAAMQALSSTLDLKQVLDLILTELRKVVPYDSASVQVVHDGYAEIIAAYGLQRGEQVIGFRFDLIPGVTPNAEVVATRAPVILDDAPVRYAHFNSEPYNADPIHSWLGVPLIFGERLTGMLTLDKYQPGFFTHEHARLAAAFATQAAIALENARLYEEARRQLAERQRVEAEQRQSQKMEALGRLAGGIAHDFNNVLTVILGEVGLLLGDLPADDPRRYGLEQILQAAERAAALTRQLLAFSRRQVLQPDLLNLNEVITGMEQMLRRLIGEDVTLTMLLCHHLPPVLADHGQIEQVVMNLVINARDAMPQGGQLVIQTVLCDTDIVTAPPAAGAQAGPYVVLIVSDTGIGIDPAVQPHIFEPFFTTKPRDRGTGLGLALVHGIVQQSGGFIRFNSRLNQGTTFEIYLPVATSVASVSPAPLAHSDVLPVAGGTVLLVEDDAAVRLLTSQILHRAGFTVLEASDGYHALQLAEQHAVPIDLLLTDIVMPEGLNGVQLASAIRAHRPAIAVVYMSGYTDDARIEAIQGERFIQKPFTPEVLIQTLSKVLTTHAPPASQINAHIPR